ncbi:MAG: hypothetical protein ABJR46_17395 [Tateyamaria sp.]|uniref:hypothetical protein n=1 Tax=Tateyamaria sp. TaxID=1929288 RepID=UPI00329BD5DA
MMRLFSCLIVILVVASEHSVGVSKLCAQDFRLILGFDGASGVGLWDFMVQGRRLPVDSNQYWRVSPVWLEIP